MIDMGGGFVVDDVYPVTTHVIAEENDANLRARCMKFRKVHIVSAEWVIDSFCY